MNNTSDDSGNIPVSSIENRLDVSEPFRYPDEEDPTPDPNEKALDLLHRLASYVIPSTNPRLALTSLCFSAGFDVGILFGVENTETAISKVLGIPKQTFAHQVKQVRKDFGLNHSTTKKHGVTDESYSNNAKKVK